MSQSVVVLLSGGLDSTTLCAYLLEQRYHVLALSVHYGQTHKREIEAARRVAEYYGLQHHVSKLSSKLFRPNALLPSGKASALRGEYSLETISAFEVPGRNLLFLALSASFAVRERATAVAIAVHAGDHPLYPDCRPEFIEAARQALRLGVSPPVSLLAPFVTLTKSEIVKRGAALRAPFHLTYSCYAGGESHCGECPTCRERQDAFRLSGVPDPTVYQGGGTCKN